MRNVITLSELTSVEVQRVFSITEDLKTKFLEGLREPLLPGRVAALLFEHPSLRTRVSFEAGMAHLGGQTLFLGREVGWGSRESAADFGRVISQFVDVLVVRAKHHSSVLEMAEHCTCSVINGLTDFAHPCQALADLYTLYELVGRLQGRKVAYIGDANNCAKSLAEACGHFGMCCSIAAPEGYQLDDEFVNSLQEKFPNLELELTSDPAVAVQDTSAVYTDVWTSMGQEEESAKRRADLADYQVNAELMSKAPTGAYFMHPLPAHRGEEVTDEVMDGPQSVVVQQAGNRLHVQKGLLVWLLGAMS